MGTWGPGPFDSDTAEDFLDEIEALSTSQRLMALQRIFDSALEQSRSPSPRVLPEEVLAAAAVVFANVSTSQTLPGMDEYPSIADWLDQPIDPSLALSATRALRSAIPADSWFWRSWVDPKERVEAQAAFEILLSGLRIAAEGGSH